MPLLGGGVTLKRVIGNDINKFDWFIKTIHFPCEPLPNYASKVSLCHPYWDFSRKLRPILGCRLSCFLQFNYLSRMAHARMVAVRTADCLGDKIEGSKVLICPNSLSALTVIHHLRKSYSFEYVTWMMDDHLIQWRKGRWCYPAWGSENLLRENLRGAREVLVISNAMREFYRERFGVNSTVVCSPAEISGEEPTVKCANSQLLRLVYFGSLGPWQNDAVCLLAPFIESKEVSLDVYSQNLEAIPVDLVRAGVSRNESIKPEEILNKASNYDAIVLPVSFKEELMNMSYFNIATKFSECLAAKIPTLLIGPESSIMVKTASAAGACAIVSKAEHAAVRSALERLKNPQQRRWILDAEWRLLASEFSQEVMRRRWEPAKAFLFS